MAGERERFEKQILRAIEISGNKRASHLVHNFRERPPVHMVQTRCQWCGDLFEIYVWQKKKYCSKRCYGLARTTPPLH